MEIADAFIINKADRADADLFANNLKKIIQQKETHLPVFKTIASTEQGIDELSNFISSAQNKTNNRKELLLYEKAYKLLQHKHLAGINKNELRKAIALAVNSPDFNLYNFIEAY